MIESKFIEQFSTDKHLLLHETEHLEIEGKMAATLIERWGMDVGIEDGEDSAGRAKFRPATPKEVVDKAVEMAGLFMTKARAMGWVHVAGSIVGHDKDDTERLR